MPFRITARTILQLGAELISSDAVAFYELIKNAFDARSPRIRIRVVVRLPHDELMAAREALDHLPQVKAKDRPAALEEIRDRIVEHIDRTAPDAKTMRTDIANAESEEEVSGHLEQLNYIEFEDTGEGMSLRDLDAVYLTIGTRSRYQQRKEREGEDETPINLRPILGEKGLGRLSTMRLGRRLHIESSTKGEAKLNVLNIDWTRFSHDSDELLEDVPVSPEPGPKKADPDKSGTLIRISGLESAWSTEKLAAIAKGEFSKLTDPFVPANRYPISLRFNGEPVAIPQINELLFEHAHATVTAKLEVPPASPPRFAGHITYKEKEKTFELVGAHLLSATKLMSLQPLRTLGPFSVQAYWFNRRVLTAIEGIGELKQVRELVAQWAGGLMLYRDGFRVLPYGGPADDWLSLDPTALAAGGYKVNRRQIIGKVDITSARNPRLVDQTNREGLRKCAESDAFVILLQHLLMGELKPFLDVVDRELQATEKLRFDDIEQRVESHEDTFRRTLDSLVKKHPEVRDDADLLASLQDILRQIRDLMEQASKLAKSFEKGRSQLVHLAGLGLILESIAHELGRATTHTLATLAEADRDELPPDIRGVFGSLESQLKTLQKRLDALDPLSTATRQTKEKFDLVTWVRQTLEGHQAQFTRHGIKWSFTARPKNGTLEVKAVKGMFFQILENLITNSVYWLKQEQKLDRSFEPEITVVVHVGSREIHFTDNGPGIPPDRKDEIFEPFVTTKPPGEGKGLGLYISREIAAYHGANLYLSDKHTVHPESLNTFVLALEGAK